MDRASVTIQRAVKLAELNSGRRGVPVSVLEESFGQGFKERYATGHDTLAGFFEDACNVFEVLDDRVCLCNTVQQGEDCDDGLQVFIGDACKRAMGENVVKTLSAFSFHAAVAKSATAVQLVLERDLRDINEKDSYGRTPLMAACRLSGPDDIVKLLTDNGADCNVVDADGWTAVCHTAWAGNDGVLQYLRSKGANCHIKTNTGDTALHFACTNNHTQCITQLLEAGVTPLPNNKRETPLYAAALSGSAAVINALVQVMKDEQELSMQTAQGKTPAHAAATNGHVRCVEILITADEDLLTRKDSEGRTVLHEATSNGHLKLVKMLLGKGAQNDPDMHGKTPLHMAALQGHHVLLEEFCRHDLNPRDAEGHTPLHCACELGRAESVKTLLRLGCDVNLPVSMSNYKAVHIAAAQGQIEALAAILEQHPAQVTDTTEHSNMTPLHAACMSDSLESIIHLLKHEPDVNVLDSEAYSPLHLAACNPREAVMRTLLNGKGLRSETLRRKTQAGDTIHDLLNKHAVIKPEELACVTQLMLMVQERTRAVFGNEELTVREGVQEEYGAELHVLKQSMKEEYATKAFNDEMKGIIVRRFPYAELVLPDTSLDATLINVAMRELYIPDEEFKELFGTEKDRYKLWPTHRKETRKKELNLLDAV